jgi:uncharacterized protein YkwD
MYRVAVPVGLALLLSACSLTASKPLSYGFSDTPAETAQVKRKRPSSSDALGGEPTAERPPVEQKIARLDKAPAGTFERAQKGALSDRDYTTTLLDAEKARAVVNAYRAEKGLKPLKLNTELTNAAKAHSRDLAKWDRISHFGSDGSNPWDRVKRVGYNAKLAAENVGTGQITFEEVMKGWKDSPGHNKNLLLADAEHMGIALVHEPKTEFKTFWTLVIGSAM